MKREEAKSCIGTIEMLQRLAYNIHGVMDVIDANNCKKIIKALEQEPCEDAISKAEVIKLIDKHTNDDGTLDDDITCILEELPPIQPKAKVGRWISIYGNVKCSVCGNVKDGRSVGKATHYCDFCGAKMESEG